ncbi:MAG TPA: DsbA family oxidoreductase [Spirochaetia bacterium]|jgi:protein disulfide-isomerase|nr:DsbA family oxidoreductase [Spirochaetia bacterium]
MADSEKIQVEIWSDVQCPFCYMGKRQFEAALESFPGKDRVEVTWRSYQLDPGLEPRVGESIQAYLARKKGMSLEQSQGLHARVAQSAAALGLDYRFDTMVVANSRAAHRLIQAAKARGLGDRVEEALFRAYFTEGRDLGNQEQLVALGVAVGLSPDEATDAVEDPRGTWDKLVAEEIDLAQEFGSTGVPFFVFQRRFAVTGAQGEETFLRVLDRVGSDPGPRP